MTLFDRVFGGNDAVYGLTEGAIDGAIAQYGEDKAVSFPNTAYSLPCYYAVTGTKVTTLKELKEAHITPKDTLLFVFTTYEEVGHGCSSLPMVDEILVVDMGCVGADLTCTEEMVSICAKDGSGPYDYKMTSKLIHLAKENNLNYAIDVYPFYSSDGSAALRGGNDIKCALIGAGIQASHGMERTHINGLNNTYKLIKLYIENK